MKRVSKDSKNAVVSPSRASGQQRQWQGIRVPRNEFWYILACSVIVIGLQVRTAKRFLPRSDQRFLTSANGGRFRVHSLFVEYDDDSNNLKVLPPFLEYDEGLLKDDWWQYMLVKRVQLNLSDESSLDDMGTACKPMHEWQMESHETCSPLHQLDMGKHLLDGTLFLASCGEHRCTYRIGELDDNVTIGLKIRNHHGDAYKEGNFKRARKDSIVMERLSGSPYVLSMFGSCGVSQVVEYADGGTLHDLLQRVNETQKQVNSTMLSPNDKLRIAIQVLTAVADLHSIDGEGRASVAHNALNSKQFVLVNGVYKLNDFDQSYLLERNEATNITCWMPAVISSRDKRNHAPEESFDERVVFMNERADDYTAGNILYSILTHKLVFEDISDSKAIELLRKGKRPPVPRHLLNSSNIADKAMLKGIKALWVHNARTRKSARAVSIFLIKVLEKLTGQKLRAEVVRVSNPLLSDLHKVGTLNKKLAGDSHEEENVKE